MRGVTTAKPGVRRPTQLRAGEFEPRSIEGVADRVMLNEHDYKTRSIKLLQAY